MAAYDPTRAPQSPDGEMGIVRRMFSWVLTLVVVVVTVGFALGMIAAATGNLDMVKGWVGL